MPDVHPVQETGRPPGRPVVDLLLASLLWAFSFGLIKDQLSGVDPVLVSLIRLGLASLAFAPFLGGRLLGRGLEVRILGLGCLQFGLMYILYIASFAYLPAWLVALFTVFTPLYVVGLVALRDREVQPRFLGGALLAVAGAGVVVFRGLPAGSSWQGILLLQGANLAFAAGQVFYGNVKRQAGLADRNLLARMYLGAVFLPAIWLLVRGLAPGKGLAPEHWPALLYLGLVPTALGFYFWNRGAAAGREGILAAANNLKVPLAVIVAWLVFGEEAEYGRVMAGLALVVAGLFLAGSSRAKV